VFQFSLPLGRAALAATRSNATLVDYLLSHQPRKPDGARAPHPCTALRALAKNKRRARRQNARRLPGSAARRSNTAQVEKNRTQS